MRVLVVTGRFPEPRHNGDKSRLFAHISGLTGRHELTVLTAAAASTTAAEASLRELATVHLVSSGRARRAASALAAFGRGAPGQTGWIMPGAAWTEAVRLAHDHDVALVNTARSLRGKLPIPTVIDHIDAMSFNMANRARGPESLPVRTAARVEANRMRSWERRLAGWVSGQLATSEDVARLLPADPPVTVFPAAWDGTDHPAAAAGRDIDVILTGAMNYPPNRDAAERLAHRILPAIRRERPDVTAYVVGRQAASLGELPGVTIASDVPDVAEYLARAKVALIPLGAGAGSPYKTLEAAAAGAAIVATPWAVECYAMEVPTAGDDDGFVRETLALLADPAQRAQAAEAGRRALAANTVEALGRKLEAVLQQAVSGQSGPAIVAAA